MPSAAERFITTLRLCTEIIEASLPRMAHSERADLRVAVGAGLAQPPATGMRVHLEATRGRRTASPAAIEERPLTAALKGTEHSRATADSPAANEVLLDADRARRAPVASAATAALRRADPLHMEQGMEAPVVRTVADTLAAGMPAVDTVAVEVTAAADTAAGAKRSGSSLPFQSNSKAPLSRVGLSQFSRPV